jgi:hypothetical protein
MLLPRARGRLLIAPGLQCRRPPRNANGRCRLLLPRSSAAVHIPDILFRGAEGRSTPSYVGPTTRVHYLPSEHFGHSEWMRKCFHTEHTLAHITLVPVVAVEALGLGEALEHLLDASVQLATIDCARVTARVRQRATRPGGERRV